MVKFNLTENTALNIRECGLTCILPYKNRIVESFLIQENTIQWKYFMQINFIIYFSLGISWYSTLLLRVLPNDCFGCLIWNMISNIFLLEVGIADVRNILLYQNPRARRYSSLYTRVYFEIINTQFELLIINWTSTKIKTRMQKKKSNALLLLMLRM